MRTHNCERAYYSFIVVFAAVEKILKRALLFTAFTF